MSKADLTTLTTITDLSELQPLLPPPKNKAYIKDFIDNNSNLLELANLFISSSPAVEREIYKYIFLRATSGNQNQNITVMLTYILKQIIKNKNKSAYAFLHVK